MDSYIRKDIHPAFQKTQEVLWGGAVTTLVNYKGTEINYD